MEDRVIVVERREDAELIPIECVANRLHEVTRHQGRFARAERTPICLQVHPIPRGDNLDHRQRRQNAFRDRASAPVSFFHIC